MDWELVKDIATIASPIIGVIAIIVALCISRRSSRQAQNSLKDIVAHQADINWGHLEHYCMKNKFEMAEEENRLAFLQKKISEFEKASICSKLEMDELKMQRELLSTRIKNRQILHENYTKILKNFDESTKSILFTKTDLGNQIEK